MNELFEYYECPELKAEVTLAQDGGWTVLKLETNHQLSEKTRYDCQETAITAYEKLVTKLEAKKVALKLTR